MKRYEITTTLMKKIIVPEAKDEEAAIKIAKSQFTEEYETVLMVSSSESL